MKVVMFVSDCVINQWGILFIFDHAKSIFIRTGSMHTVFSYLN